CVSRTSRLAVVIHSRGAGCQPGNFCRSESANGSSLEERRGMRSTIFGRSGASRLRGWFKSVLVLAVMLVGFAYSAPAAASHFRYGTISWKVPDVVNAPLTVEFTVTTAWRSTLPDGTFLQFGDGANNGTVLGTQ